MNPLDDGAPLVFVHGIKGGHLKDAGGRRWVGAWQALGLDRRPLLAPLAWSVAGQAHDDLQADGPIEKVLWVAIYANFLERARGRHRHFESYSYDWRREIPEASKGLVQRLRTLAEQHGRPARIIAHSMGGLVTLHALRAHPELCCGVLFAGTPFGTGIGFTHDAHVGATTGLNSRLLSPEAVNSWAAHWVFFPTSSHEGLEADGKALEHDWYDPDSWAHHRLGVYAATREKLDRAAYGAHLREAMTRARATRERLEDPGGLSGRSVPVAILRSRAQGTPDCVVKGGPKAVLGWDTQTVRHVPGDGRVKYPATEPPGVEFQAFETSKGHDALLDDHAKVEAALAWLIEQTAR